MCLNTVGDLHNNFFIESAGVTADVDVLIFIGFENCDQFITCKKLRIHIYQHRC